MKKSMIIGMSLALALLLTATTALASNPKCEAGFDSEFKEKYSLLSSLSLTQEQSFQIQRIQEAFRKEIEPLRQHLLTKEAELESLVLIPNPDQDAVMVKQKEVWQIQSELHQKAVYATQKLRKLLTPDQQAKLPDFSSGIIGAKGFHPGMCVMLGMGEKRLCPE